MSHPTQNEVSYSPVQYRRLLIGMAFWAVSMVIMMLAWLTVVIYAAPSMSDWPFWVALLLLFSTVVFTSIKFNRSRVLFGEIAPNRQFTRHYYGVVDRYNRRVPAKPLANVPFGIGITEPSGRDMFVLHVVPNASTRDGLPKPWSYRMTPCSVTPIDGSPDPRDTLELLERLMSDPDDYRAQIVSALMAQFESPEIPTISPELREARALMGDI